MSLVAIVEDHELLAETLASALEGSGLGARVYGATGRSADELLADLVADRPDLVLLDLDLGHLGDSTAMIAPLAEAGLRVLVVTGSGDRLRWAAALEAGAVGYQPKGPGLAALLARVGEALERPGPLDPGGQVQLLAELRRARSARRAELAPFERLTEREAQTLRGLADGRSVADLAAEWVVSEATMRTHVRGVLAKLGVGSQLAAVALAARSGWLDARPTPVDLTGATLATTVPTPSATPSPA